MLGNRLVPGKDVPDDYHVARYCFEDTIREVIEDGIRYVVEPRAFERGRDKAADVSFSVMEKFGGGSDADLIVKVCIYRGNLGVREGGYYVKLNVGKITSERYQGDSRKLRLIFEPGYNPAHANLYSEGLMVSTELAALANREGKFFPVPSPVPDAIIPG